MAEALLTVNNIEVVYHDVILVLKGVSLTVKRGEVVALLGTNGAGKTTTLRAISGLLESEDGRVRQGSVELATEGVAHDGAGGGVDRVGGDGAGVDVLRGGGVGLDGSRGGGLTQEDAPRGGMVRLDRLPPEAIVRLGVVQVLEGRRIFKHLTVEENLMVGAATRAGRGWRADVERVYRYFPRLAELRFRLAGYCSGGEQQMLAIGRALLARPRLLLLDEPSLGLSPLLVREIFDIIRRINQEEGATVLLVEQNARMALSAAHRGYVMENGRVVLEGSAEELRANPDVQEFYLGLSGEGSQKSYRDVKAYRRRKRYM